jgi:hypothetical protein
MGKERVRVLVAFWLLWGASFQVSKGFRENVIVTHTRVRIPLGHVGAGVPSPRNRMTPTSASGSGALSTRSPIVDYPPSHYWR